jgi:hypothetical protein
VGESRKLDSGMLAGTTLTVTNPGSACDRAARNALEPVGTWCLERHAATLTRCRRKGAMLQRPSWAGMHVAPEPKRPTSKGCLGLISW